MALARNFQISTFCKRALIDWLIDVDDDDDDDNSENSNDNNFYNMLVCLILTCCSH